MRPQPRVRQACWISARRSERIVKRRMRFNPARVRSTTQRWRPNRWLDSVPLRAMRG